MKTRQCSFQYLFLILFHTPRHFLLSPTQTDSPYSACYPYQCCSSWSGRSYSRGEVWSASEHNTPLQKSLLRGKPFLFMTLT